MYYTRMFIRWLQDARRNFPLRHILPIAEDLPPPYKAASETPPPSYEEALYRQAGPPPAVTTPPPPPTATVQVRLEKASTYYLVESAFY